MLFSQIIIPIFSSLSFLSLAIIFFYLFYFPLFQSLSVFFHFHSLINLFLPSLSPSPFLSPQIPSFLSVALHLLSFLSIHLLYHHYPPFSSFNFPSLSYLPLSFPSYHIFHSLHFHSFFLPSYPIISHSLPLQCHITHP